MAEQSYAARKRMAKKTPSRFVYPPTKANPQGRYPIYDLPHARAALQRVSQHGSSSEQTKVKAAVYRKFPALKKRAEKRGKK